MALENAKKFLKQMITDETLRKRLEGKTSAEASAIAGELGFDVNAEELVEALKALRNEAAEDPNELSPDEMDKAAGGTFWGGEDAPDGHEMGCALTYHGYDWSKEHNTWCQSSFYCTGNHLNKNGVYHREDCYSYYNGYFFGDE